MRRSSSISALTAASVLLLASPGALARPFSVEPDAPKPAAAPAPAAPAWEQARAFPAWVAVLAAGVAQEREASFDALRPGPDGVLELRLEDALKLAIENNLNVLVRRYEPQLAAEAVREREAIFEPLFAATFSFFQDTSPTTGALAGASVLTQRRFGWNAKYSGLYGPGTHYEVGFDNTRDSTNSNFASLNPSYDAGLNFLVTQPLLRQFGFDVARSEISIAVTQKELADESFRGELINTVAAVVDRYWELHLRIENLEVQRDALRLARELLSINRTRVEVGTMAPLEVAQAEAQVARAEENVIIAEQVLHDSEDGLRTLLNVPFASPLWNAGLRPADKPVVETVHLDLDDALAQAFAKRPELRRSRLGLDIDDVRLDVARNQLKPKLDISAGFGTNGVGGTLIRRDTFGSGEVLSTTEGGYSDAFRDAFGFDFRQWQLRADFAIPIFNQAAESRHAQAVLARQRDEDVVRQVEQSIAEEVRRSVRQVDTSRKRIDAAKASRTYQEKSLDAETKKFEHGLSTNFEVLRVQQDLTEARTGEVQAVTDYRRALAALHRTMGSLLESYDIALEPELEAPSRAE